MFQGHECPCWCSLGFDRCKSAWTYDLLCLAVITWYKPSKGVSCNHISVQHTLKWTDWRSRHSGMIYCLTNCETSYSISAWPWWQQVESAACVKYRNLLYAKLSLWSKANSVLTVCLRVFWYQRSTLTLHGLHGTRWKQPWSLVLPAYRSDCDRADARP